MSRGIRWSGHSWDDYLYWQSQDKKTLKRINALVKDCQRDPYEGIGKPEPLRGDLDGWWSRRIDDKNRLIYQADDEIVSIAGCRDHYDDR